jgi:hypothetical protein
LLVPRSELLSLSGDEFVVEEEEVERVEDEDSRAELLVAPDPPLEGGGS